ncbi:hypothetical protein Mgra_00005226 [Meloidogyne graminicola]|uniref:Uncharacterized protein n=1 Tax=Meloidogyne graminicola TaxID=189291 RepID=A0A8S9ZPB8_9BILA|nr:hypothetical protein Mgra_00005226 [Meloidogyne graminicola]
MKNRPVVNSQVILPSLLSGAIWGIGMICLFLSNDLLTQTITYPILITIPGCIASIWSIFYFKEIPLVSTFYFKLIFKINLKNRRNLLINLIAFGLIFIGALFVFLSKRNINL